MSDREKCVVCDFPLATKEDSVAAQAAGKTFMEVVERGGLCWGYHRDPANDYKARVEALEGALNDVRRRIEIMGEGEQSDSVRVHNRLLHQSEDALAVIDAALSATPPKPAPRPDATEALRVAMEALEATRVATFPYTDKGNAAQRLCDTALELLRAHVTSTKQPVEQGTKS